MEISELQYAEKLVEINALRAENGALYDRIQDEVEAQSIRIDALETRLRYTLGALEAVEFINISYAPEYDISTRRCPWCKNALEKDHKPDCLRQLALSMPPQDIGEK